MIDELELLDEADRRYAADPLKYTEQHPKQQEASAALQPIRSLFWGNRVGKTEWGAQEVAKYALNRHQYREIGSPVEIWCACPSYDTQEETTQKKLLLYIPKAEIAHISYISGRIIKKMRLKNGTIITFKSYEQGREKFQGAGKRLIWFDEEPPHDIWEECFVRVEAGVQLDIILTMTAIKGMTWVYDDIYLQRGLDPDLFVSEAGWDDNPWLTEQQKQQMARGLRPEALKVRREGKFVKRVGLVCSWWDRSKHLKHYDFLDRTWTWYEALDGGFSDPLAYLLIGVDHDNSIHVVSGFRKKGLMPDRIVGMRNTRRAGLMISGGYTDNDDPRLQRQLANLGFPLMPVVKEPGDAASWDEFLAMKLDEYGMVQPGTGQPRLFISDSLIDINEQTGKEHNWMVQEIENLVWLEKVSKQGEEIVPKWDDHRRYGHHFDGMRTLGYFMAMYQKPIKPFRQERNRQTGINLSV